MKWMVSERESLREGSKTLRTGFICSLVSLVLFVFLWVRFYVPSTDLVYGVFFFYVSPFLALFIWAYGAFKRAKGWNLAGQENAAVVLSLSWKVNFLFILLPLLLSLLGYDLIVLVISSLSLSLLVAAVTTVAWGYSTFCEAKGLKKLEEENKVSLKLPRFCSLVGVLVYTGSVLVYAYMSFAYVGNHVFPPFIVFPFFGYFFILTSSMILASPLLMISCITAIIRLKQVTNQPTPV